MTKNLRAIDISDSPDLLRVVEEVQATHEPRLLRRKSEDVAIITPLRPRKRTRIKGRPIRRDDPLWNIVGIGRSSGPTDVSVNKHKYLAEAYTPRPE
ncbi:MAG: hypothetical protein Q7O66_15170 [Dehalococcoidia bacterium]|nr:hypothetical protein [Dehalococcoidia bacterium]